MRTVALSAVLALVAGCSDGKKPTEGKSGPAAAKDAAAPDRGYKRSSKFGRGHPPQKVAEGRTSGRIIAANADTLFWIERSAKGNFVVGGKKAGGKSYIVAGPLNSVTDLVASANRVVISATAISKSAKNSGRGVLVASAAGGGKAVQLSETAGKLAIAGDFVYVLHRGSTTESGSIVRLRLDGKGKPTTVMKAPSQLGRAALTAAGEKIYWLGDRRDLVGKIKKRVGFLQTLQPNSTAPKMLAEGFASPGVSLQVHGDYVYFTAKEAAGLRRLYRAPVAGGEVEPLLAERWEVLRFVVAGNGIYVYANFQGWKIARFELGKTEPKVLASPERPLTSQTLLVDAQHIYWGSNGSLLRVPTSPPSKPMKMERGK